MRMNPLVHCQGKGKSPSRMGPSPPPPQVEVMIVVPPVSKVNDSKHVGSELESPSYYIKMKK